MTKHGVNVDDVATDIGAGQGQAPGLRLLAAWSGGAVTRAIAPRERLVIGRGTDADLRIDHASVSRRHALFVVSTAAGDDLPEVRVEDLGSSNGTFIDGRRLEAQRPTVVKPGSVVEVGSVIVSIRGGAPRRAVDAAASDGVVVADPQMLRLYELIEVVARSSLPVILLGETGSGKEVLARRIHQLSPRAAMPFGEINCGALVETLLEAELFGHERGAFTGAVSAKPGLLENAHGGTLLLDELGEMPLATQVKFLRVIEQKQVLRVGALKPRPIDVRFVAATNRDLAELIAAGRFRQDLFFRLDGVSIRIPPLRERVAEIAPLAEAFLRRACAEAGRPPAAFAEDAIAALLHHRWPGNVRELLNVVSRTALLTPGPVLRASDLRFDAIGSPPAAGPSAAPPPPLAPPPLASPPLASPPAPSAPQDEERARIVDALERCAGNQTKAAKLLGLTRRQLVHRLDTLGLPRPRKQIGDDRDDD